MVPSDERVVENEDVEMIDTSTTIMKKKDAAEKF